MLRIIKFEIYKNFKKLKGRYWRGTVERDIERGTDYKKYAKWPILVVYCKNKTKNKTSAIYFAVTPNNCSD